jgi:hypothetical protein
MQTKDEKECDRFADEQERTSNLLITEITTIFTVLFRTAGMADEAVTSIPRKRGS